ncbi:MAG: AraC family transcriptional regulator [Clostridiales bacterium]|nr:AraC family transcriptional regulator [Clostridiales bacterium]
MEQEQRIMQYDPVLGVEAYRFTRLAQEFPNHFHDYCVIGCILRGKRRLRCDGLEHLLEPGDLLLLNPRQTHACRQEGKEALDWICLHAGEGVLQSIAREITGVSEPLLFSSPVVRCDDLTQLFTSLHSAILQGRSPLEREEGLYLLMDALVHRFSASPAPHAPACCEQVEQACSYMEENLPTPITLAALSRESGLAKHTLLRRFVREKGITPDQYLEALRVNAAKDLLAQGRAPADAALETGFSDQSHFTRFFKNYIGLTPGQYRQILAGPQRADTAE